MTLRLKSLPANVLARNFLHSLELMIAQIFISTERYKNIISIPKNGKNVSLPLIWGGMDGYLSLRLI